MKRIVHGCVATLLVLSSTACENGCAGERILRSGEADGAPPPLAAPTADANVGSPRPPSATDQGPGIEGAGVGTDSPFDIHRNESAGVVVNPEGELTLDWQASSMHLIWVANSKQGTVSKIDTRSFEELARYVTGPDGASNDPSRTSVNTVGDVYVANREGQTVSRISALGPGCPDTNGDGVITTSTGPTDILPWGEDDCVLWNTSLEGGGVLRAAAAQDLFEPDGDVFEYVWIGGFNRRAWKLNGETGEVLVDMTTPFVNYGFAMDGEGTVWVSATADRGLGYIDSNDCDDSGCATGMIPFPDGHVPYGITVDEKQRVWLSTVTFGKVFRYDPTAPAGNELMSAGIGHSCNGIAADGKGFIWAACRGSGVIRISADDPNSSTQVSGTAINDSKGIAVDGDGKIWSINLADNDITVITPGPTLHDNGTPTWKAVTGLARPYTYSDMTGQQLRLVIDPVGYYRTVLEGCQKDDIATHWGWLTWEAQTPAGSTVRWRVRTGDTAVALASAEWQTVGLTPPESPPVNVGLYGAFMEVEAQLRGDGVSTPTVRSFQARNSCDDSVF